MEDMVTLLALGEQDACQAAVDSESTRKLKSSRAPGIPVDNTAVPGQPEKIASRRRAPWPGKPPCAGTSSGYAAQFYHPSICKSSASPEREEVFRSLGAGGFRQIFPFSDATRAMSTQLNEKSSVAPILSELRVHYRAAAAK